MEMLEIVLELWVRITEALIKLLAALAVWNWDIIEREVRRENGRPTWVQEHSRKRAVWRQMLSDATAMEAIRGEPELKKVVGQAFAQKPYPGYNRARTYDRLKRRAAQLVGMSAQTRGIADSRHYDAIIHYIGLLLPSDGVGLGSDDHDVEPDRDN